MEVNKQNACLMTTTFDEETGKTILTYIPMALDFELVNKLLEVGHNCNNKICVEFEIDTDENYFWEDMWSKLRSED